MKKRPQHKWAKLKMLKNSRKLARYLPTTRRFSWKSLWDFIAKYETIMLKPYYGKSGIGIIQVSTLGNNRYAIQEENQTIILDGKKSVYVQLKRMTGLKKYMVQRRIPLAEIDRCPFDLKVLVQRSKLSWKVIGMLAIVAEKDYVITNVTRNILPVDKAIAQSLLNSSPNRKLITNVKKVCLLAAKKLGDCYPSQNKICFDIGLDKEANIWIIEANFKPSIKPFLILKCRSAEFTH